MCEYLKGRYMGRRKILTPRFLSLEYPDKLFTGRAYIHGRKHFGPSQAMHDQWKPCVKIIRHPSRNTSSSRITEVPCDTRSRPSIIKTNLVKRRIKSVTSVNRSIDSDLISDVRHLEKWEEQVLNAETVMDKYNKFKTAYPSQEESS